MSKVLNEVPNLNTSNWKGSALLKIKTLPSITISPVSQKAAASVFVIGAVIVEVLLNTSYNLSGKISAGPAGPWVPLGPIGPCIPWIP